MTRRARSVVLAVVLAAAASVTPALAETVDDEPTDELERTEAELDAAEEDLAQLLAEIDAVEAEVAAADARLADLQGQLAAVETQLGAARETAAEAATELAAAQRAVAPAHDALATAEAAWEDAHGTLAARVAATWMHGGTGGPDLLVEGLLRASDLHDVALAQQAHERLLAHDQVLLETAISSAEAAADAAVDAEVAQEAAGQAARDAFAAEQAAEDLLETQQRLVADATATRSARRAALARIEQDAAARAALVDRLTQRLLELRIANLDQWLRQIADLPFDGPPPAWADALPASGRPLGAAIDAAAAASGLDGRLLAALVWTESSFNPAAVSPAGAIGLTQLMPPTAAGLGVDPYDPLQNLLGGGRYLRQQIDRFGRIDLALAAYNAGPTRVANAGNQIPDIVETQLYVLRVLDRWQRLGGGA